MRTSQMSPGTGNGCAARSSAPFSNFFKRFRVSELRTMSPSGPVQSRAPPINHALSSGMARREVSRAIGSGCQPAGPRALRRRYPNGVPEIYATPARGAADGPDSSSHSEQILGRAAFVVKSNVSFALAPPMRPGNRAPSSNSSFHRQRPRQQRAGRSVCLVV